MRPSLRTTNWNLYVITQQLFWLMPGFVRNLLNGPRHLLVRWFRSSGYRSSSVKLFVGDLDWFTFQEQVLGNCNEFSNIIIFETNVDWGIALFQRPQQMAIALGRIGNLIIYKTTGDDLIGFRRVAENVWITNDYSVDLLNGVCRCFYSTSLFASADIMREMRKKGVVIYEYIDHIDPQISGGNFSFRRLKGLQCMALGGAADIVIASASSLFEEAIKLRGEDACIYVPNGVEVEHYRKQENLLTSLPRTLTDFRNLYPVIVGYFGAIAPWLWYEVIDQIAEQMPQIGFVFIGPDYSGCVSKLPRRDNIHYAGTVAYSVLPEYARMFDVCCIPFRPGNIARSTSPLKLFEYFALEKPVVVTSDMSECVAFPEVFSGFDAVTFVSAIKQAVKIRNDICFKARLRELAEENSWNVRAIRYMDAINKIRKNRKTNNQE